MNLKHQAAQHALGYVESDMVIGLGTGSTTAFFIEMLAERLQSGSLNDIQAVPTSIGTAERAGELGIPLTTLTAHPHLDLAVDGADEVDPYLNLIKGLGRALLREKMVEIYAKRFIVIVDESKIVSHLGMRVPLPVELVKFEAEATINWLESLGCRAELWLEDNGALLVTDNGNYYARCWFQGGIEDPYALARRLAGRPGIVEHGLFLDMADMVIVARRDGIEILER